MSATKTPTITVCDTVLVQDGSGKFEVDIWEWQKVIKTHDCNLGYSLPQSLHASARALFQAYPNLKPVVSRFSSLSKKKLDKRYKALSAALYGKAGKTHRFQMLPKQLTPEELKTCEIAHGNFISGLLSSPKDIRRMLGLVKEYCDKARIDPEILYGRNRVGPHWVDSALTLLHCYTKAMQIEYFARWAHYRSNTSFDKEFTRPYSLLTWAQLGNTLKESMIPDYAVRVNKDPVLNEMYENMTDEEFFIGLNGYNHWFGVSDLYGSEYQMSTRMETLELVKDLTQACRLAELEQVIQLESLIALQAEAQRLAKKSEKVGEVVSEKSGNLPGQVSGNCPDPANTSSLPNSSEIISELAHLLDATGIVPADVAILSPSDLQFTSKTRAHRLMAEYLQDCAIGAPSRRVRARRALRSAMDRVVVTFFGCFCLA